ncbi:hypothetical protein Tco_1049602, partial [Tanacetum coccineum]
VGQVRILHVPSRYQFADIFTKGLPSALFEEFRTSLSMMDMKDLFETKAKGRSDGKAKEKMLVLIPDMTFVAVESRVLILEITFVGVESRVLIPEMTFVSVESRVLIPVTTVWDTLVYPSDTLVICKQKLE